MADKDIIIMEEIVKDVFKKQPSFESFKPKVLTVLNYERLKNYPPGFIRGKKGKDIEYLILKDESHINSADKWPMFYIKLQEKNDVKQILENYFKNNNL